MEGDHQAEARLAVVEAGILHMEGDHQGETHLGAEVDAGALHMGEDHQEAHQEGHHMVGGMMTTVMVVKHQHPGKTMEPTS